ncbi:MAG: hypothetical protein GXZ09_05860 [Syntrophomonadaceae bacterium]|jgi:hypothetical protein|nr:hypothetical protein [Syntrophomonadaceae bacterium]
MPHKPIREIDSIRDPFTIDSFRVGYSEDGKFVIDFASVENKDDEVVVDIKSKIIIADDKVTDLVMYILKAIIEYEKEHNKILLPRKEGQD